MGISINFARMLLQSFRQEGNFESTLMIGRLAFHLQKHRLEKAMLKAGLPPAVAADSVKDLSPDAFLRALGARTIDSVDVSDYQDCSIVHDMNTPLPAACHRKYSAVLEGGTIEHVFNVAQAMQNCMDAVAMGGRLYIWQMGGNNAGHGFFSFSPEFFYRALEEKYGFTVELMLMHEYTRPDRIYKIKDSKEALGNVNITTDYGTNILVQARRTGEGDSLMRSHPQQFSYTKKWEAGSGAASGPKMSPKHSFLHDLPWYSQWQWDRRVRRSSRRKKASQYFGNPAHFEPYDFSV